MTIKIDKLAAFRRDLRKVDKEADKELRKSIKSAAEIVARTASQYAPVGSTGKLAAGYRGTAAGNKGVVRNRVVYSRFIEFGFHPGGGTRFVPGQQPIGKAIDRRESDVIDALENAIDTAARSAGWH